MSGVKNVNECLKEKN